MESRESIEIFYSEQLVKAAIRAWWFRSALPWWSIGVAAFGTPLAIGLARGDRSWIMGACGTVVFVTTFLVWQVFRAHLQQSLLRVRRLADGKINLTVSDDGLLFTTSASSLLIRWRDINEVRLAKDHWLLFRARNDFSILPIANLGSEMRDYLIHEFRIADARVH